MSESNAAAVAERESPTQTQETTSTAQAVTPVENTNVTSDTVAADTATGASGSNEQATSDTVAAETATEPVDADGRLNAVLEKARGTSVKTSEPTQLPGRSVVDEFFDIDARQAQQYKQILQNFDQQSLSPFLKNEMGLEPWKAEQILEKLRGTLGAVHSNNEFHNRQRLLTYLRTALSKEGQAEFDRRSFVQYSDENKTIVDPWATTNEGVKLALSLREQDVNKAWEAKIESGEYLTRKEALDFAAAEVAVARSEWEQGGNSASSGQRMASGRGDNRSDAEKLADPNTPVAELKAIRNRQEGYELWR